MFALLFSTRSPTDYGLFTIALRGTIFLIVHFGRSILEGKEQCADIREIRGTEVQV